MSLLVMAQPFPDLGHNQQRRLSRQCCRTEPRWNEQDLRRRIVTGGDRFVVVVYVTSSSLFSSDHEMAVELSDKAVLVAGQYLFQLFSHVHSSSTSQFDYIPYFSITSILPFSQKKSANFGERPLMMSSSCPKKLQETGRKARKPLSQTAPLEPSSPPRYTHSPNGPGTYLILDNVTKGDLTFKKRQWARKSSTDPLRLRAHANIAIRVKARWEAANDEIPLRRQVNAFRVNTTLTQSSESHNPRWMGTINSVVRHRRLDLTGGCGKPRSVYPVRPPEP
ncbi:hypothetical protein EV421DRAFT_1912002 [Armillaria borealis]|uniref:Uncharacterized protein n=1 Tax=Armillaria borealis TaxID=47425 RepID=A0AA39IY33_9AGAR|nr:hypothetical protein EV421DRAFT_1912002 [Armillaria borealis]